MDLSINNINAQKKVSFKGMEGAHTAKSTPVFKFYAPPHNKSSENAQLEIVMLYNNEKTGRYKKPNVKTIETIPFNSDDTVVLNQEMVRELSSGFAYRYKITDKKGTFKRYELDPFKTIEDSKGQKMNVIEQGRMYGISPKSGAMYHGFLDSVGVLDDNGKLVPTDKEFVRNHFNKLGGSIAGMSYLLNNTNEFDSYTYFMTTPDIGADKVSSHRYWPSNQYQCKDLETFKKFNYELFTKGKAYVADGAFTSQGIQSPLVQHVLKWGEESPFYNMLKIDSRIKLGVLPDVSELDGTQDPYEHIGIRLVNPKGKDYNPKKPTFIQFYDDRLLSKKKQADTKNLHFDYDSVPEDHYDITTHQDSVQPYAFEIDPNDKKLAVFKDGKNTVLLKDLKDKKGENFLRDFLNFPNYSIVTKNQASGATFWDGNVDIIKMNLSNPSNLPGNREGYENAREYLLGVATYWSETIQSHLILETAKNKGKMAEIAKNNGKDISEIDISNGFSSLVLKDNKQASDFIEEFPLQSLETSEELSAIFAQPQFKKEFLSEDIRSQIFDIFNSTVQNAIPKEYKNNAQYQTYVVKTYGNEILRHLYIGALSPNSVKRNGTIDLAELKEVTLKSLEYRKSNSPKDERTQVITKLKKSIDSTNVSGLQKKMASELKDISLDDFKKAEAILIQGKGGLGWRFDAAKDVGDLDAIRDGRKTFTQIWNGDARTPGVQQFWADFITRAKKANPSALIINEITDFGDFYIWENKASMRAFDPQLANAFEELSPEEKSHYENHVAYAKQVEFLEKTNSTTTSEYDKGFGKLSAFIGVDPENGYNVQGNAGDVNRLKETAEALMKYNQGMQAMWSHQFLNNHDKPTILHTLPLNMEVYMGHKKYKDLMEEDKALLGALGINESISKKISPKAIGVGLVMKKVIDGLYEGKEQEKLTRALSNLVQGKKADGSGKTSFKRSENFGVLPFEVTIQDMFRHAGMEKESEILDFHKEIFAQPMLLQERIWQVMNASVGVPTLFGGTEFVQTGYETPSKNVYVAIRNQLKHELKNDKRYKDYYEKMNAIASLHKKRDLGALRDGTPISCEIVQEKDLQLWPLFKYNSSGSKVVSIISNLGVPKGANSFEANIKQNISANVKSIPLKASNGTCPLQDGTILKRMVYKNGKYVEANETYTVKNGAIVSAKGGEIQLNDTVSTFYIENSVNPKYHASRYSK